MNKNKVLKGMSITLATLITLGALASKYSATKEELSAVNQKLQEVESLLMVANEDLENALGELEHSKSTLEKLIENYNSLLEAYEKELAPVGVDFYDLRIPSNASVSDLTKALYGTGLEGLEWYYVEAEKLYGVNSLILASITAHESGWGNSERALSQNNLSGYAVYSPSAKGRTFNSKGESILETAKLLSQEYLDESGSYHRGYGLGDVNKLYCQPLEDYKWAKSIGAIAFELVEKING